MDKNYSAGTYICAGCDTPLVKSEHKFNSGSGWPSFDREIKGSVAFSVDYKIGIARSEEHCATCGGHLGHVFNDGPRNTTGMRHCINGAALKFIPKMSKSKIKKSEAEWKNELSEAQYRILRKKVQKCHILVFTQPPF